MPTAVVPGKTVVAPVVVSTWFVTVPNAANALVDVARIATPAVTVAARVATADRRNRLVAVVTLASIREVVVARWLSPKAQSCNSPADTRANLLDSGPYRFCTCGSQTPHPRLTSCRWLFYPNRTYVRS